jgi:hypothetical protein
MEAITQAVGIRNGVTMMPNTDRDLETVTGLLDRISLLNGGTATTPRLWLKNNKTLLISQVTAAIVAFQTINLVALQKLNRKAVIDGAVDRDGSTIKLMNQLAAPIPDTITQKNPPKLTAVHKVTNPIVRPSVTVTPIASFRFVPDTLIAEIHEFLFEVRKAGSLFWVGAAIPKGTTDFTRVQVYFHPTVVNGGVVHATDTDYKDFKGGWSRSIQRYVAMQGGQLAGAGRLMPLLVPFTTMAALVSPAKNMFNDRPVETLNAIMAAIQSEITPHSSRKPMLSNVGVSSFSSGITALRLFLTAMSSSGLVKEIIDFDSPFIISEPKQLTRSSGAVSKCFTQILHRPEIGWVTLTTDHFTAVRKFDSLHARIGWMMYHQAMINSVIR